MMELILWPSDFAAESYDVVSRDDAWQLVRAEWDRIGQFPGWLALYDASGRLVEERDWKAGDDVDAALVGW